MAKKKVEKMSYRELQKEAKKLGLSAKAPKEELRKRILEEIEKEKPASTTKPKKIRVKIIPHDEEIEIKLPTKDKTETTSEPEAPEEVSEESKEVVEEKTIQGRYGVHAIEILRIEEVVINGRDFKKVYLANGTVEVVPPEELEVRLEEGEQNH